MHFIFHTDECLQVEVQLQLYWFLFCLIFILRDRLDQCTYTYTTAGTYFLLANLELLLLDYLTYHDGCYSGWRFPLKYSQTVATRTTLSALQQKRTSLLGVSGVHDLSTASGKKVVRPHLTQAPSCPCMPLNIWCCFLARLLDDARRDPRDGFKLPRCPWGIVVATSMEDACQYGSLSCWAPLKPL